ncbi:MAG: NAD-dependent deacylase [Myxococcota bacterium]
MTLRAVAELIEASRHAVALTGAGVSTESGIPDFRSDSGLWRDVSPMDVASIDGFREDPERFYRFWAPKLLSLKDAEPSAAHRLLAGLESRGRMQAVVTQNIDGLHQKAGSTRVLEVHGTFREFRCLACGTETTMEVLEPCAALPACTSCGATRLRPKVVLFGEMLPAAFGLAEMEVRAADLLIVMGTSLEVYPVAGLVPLARRSRAKVIILNRDETALDDEADLVVNDELGATCGQLITLLGL